MIVLEFLQFIFVILCFGIGIVFCVLFALGGMDQHLKNNKRAFGHSVTPEQLRDEISAAIAADNQRKMY